MMKHSLLFFTTLFCSLQTAAQMRKVFELSPKRVSTVSPSIFSDGTFEIRFDETIYSFDSGANQLGEPLVVEDQLKKKEHLSVVDEELDIRYTIDPVLTGTGTSAARHPRVIRVEKLDGKGRFYQDIPYTIQETELPPKLANKSGYAWRMTNGDPAFVRFYIWIEDGKWRSKALQFVLHLSDNSVEITNLMNGRVPLDRTANTSAWGSVAGVIGGRLIFAVTYIEDFHVISTRYPDYVKTDFWSVDDAGRESKIHTADFEIPTGAYWRANEPVETNARSDGKDVLLFQNVYLEKVVSDDDGLYFAELNAHITEIDEKMLIKEYDFDIPGQDMVLYNPQSHQLLSCWQNGDERAFHIAVPDNLGSATVNILRPVADSGYVMSFVPEVPITKTSTEYAEVIFRPEAALAPALLDVVIHPDEAHEICLGCRHEKYAAVRIAEDGTAYILVLELLMKSIDRVGYVRGRYEVIPPVE
jgi:hypothetical protein